MRHAFLGITLMLLHSGAAQADVLSDCKKIPIDNLQATRAFNACTTIIDNTSDFGTAARAQAYNRRGGLFVAHFDKKDYRRAVADYTSSLSLEPSSANTYFNRAYAHELMGQHQIALQDYNQAIYLVPNDSEFWDGRGGLRSQLGDFTGAISDQTKALSLLGPGIDNWTKSFHLSRRAKTFLKAGKLDAAILDLSIAISLKSDGHENYYDRGTAHLAKRDIPKAIDDFKSAIALNRREQRYRAALDQAVASAR